LSLFFYHFSFYIFFFVDRITESEQSPNQSWPANGM